MANSPKTINVKFTTAELSMLTAFVLFGGDEHAIPPEGQPTFKNVKKKLLAAVRSA